MAGQGRPQFDAPYHARWLYALVTLFCALNVAQAADLDLKLRLAWGGGDACSWQGIIEVSEGTISHVQPLGLEADSPGALQPISDQTVRVFPRSPRTYDGCDLRVVGPADAILRVKLFPAGTAGAEPIELSLEKLKQGFHSVNLDEQRNRLLVQRSPGDMLRVNLSRSHLVYSPGEAFQCEVIPHVLPLAPNTAYILSAALVEARGGKERNRLDLELKSDATGSAAAVTAVDMPVPGDEGVYDVVFSLYLKRLTSTILRGKPIVERRVQLVVVDTVQRLPVSPADWKTTWEIDPANPKWWERMARIPTIPKLPGLTTEPLSNGVGEPRTHLGRTWIELPEGVWQAYPLSVEEIGRPHVLQVEYPSDLPQSLGISIVEPNAAGQVMPIGLDSGIDVTPSAAGSQAKVHRHRIIFWPQTAAPVVLLTNRRPGQRAWFGKISLQAGPYSLPPLRLPPTNVAQRMFAYALDRPLMPENFSAGEALDPATGRTLDDWVTFYLATSRLVEYAQHTGSGSIMLPVLSEGSTLYPSDLLQPTPRYDTGLFFESGQDPLRKDVLELLLRLCDRSGVQCVPTLQFTTPLPELEAQRLLDPAAAMGIEPLGSDGRAVILRRGSKRGQGPYYNPLDARVQQTMQRIVAELAARYGQHPAFSGIGLQLSPETFALLPEDMSALDERTLLAFQQQTGTSLSSLDPRHPNWRGEALNSIRTAARASWINWRAQRIAAFYRELQQTIEQQHPGGKLFVLPSELLTSRPLQFALRPSLPARDEAAATFVGLGLDPRLFASDQAIVIPRPGRAAPEFVGVSSAYEAWNRSPELTALFTGSTFASQTSLDSTPLPLPSFDQVSPFGVEQTRLWLVSHLTPSAAANRQRFVQAIARSDSRLLIDGGWMLPLGQEEALSSLIKVFRRLPDEPFQTIQPRDGGANTQPAIVRTLSRRGKTYFYVTNDSPWPITVELDWQAPGKLVIEPYSAQRDATTTSQGNRTTWSVKLEPFDLMGGEVHHPQAIVETWRVTLPTDSAEHLAEQMKGLRYRINALRSPLERNTLQNSSFERIDEGGNPLAWVYSSAPTVNVELDVTEAYRSKQSLHLQSSRDASGRVVPAWVRSAPISVPTTGRISVIAHLRVEDPAKQPRLRLAIEGKLDGQPYYRWSNVGLSEDGKPLKVQLTSEWTSYRFPLTDLPLSGLTDLRVGFDLMDEGEVWIDEVQVFDLWFDDNERDELLKGMAAADFQLSAGQLVGCQRYLESYWPQYLRHHVPYKKLSADGDKQEVTATAINAAIKPVAPFIPITPPPIERRDRERERGERDKNDRAEREAERETAEKPGMMDRLRSWWPGKAEKKTR